MSPDPLTSEATSHPRRGRPFPKGNSGRPRGSRNRTTVVAASLLDGETESLVRKAIELALAGDAQLLKFLLSRALPRERTIQLDLPRIETAEDAVTALTRILLAITQGEITPSEGAAMVAVVNSYTRALDISQLVRR